MSKAAVLALVFSVIVTSFASAQKAPETAFTTSVQRSAAYTGVFEKFDWPFTKWDRGHLITWQYESSQSRPSVMVFDGEGNVVREAVVWLPGSMQIYLRDVAMTPSGNLLIAASALNEKGALADFVAEVGASGKVVNVVRTTPFSPMRICSTGSTFWVYGWQRWNENHHPRINYSMLREYAFGQGQTNTLLDRKTFPEYFFTTGHTGEVNLVCNSSTVGLYVPEQETFPQGEYIEHSLAKPDSLLRWRTPKLPKSVIVQGYTLTENGSLFLNVTHLDSGTPLASGVFLLEKSGNQSSQWIAVEDMVHKDSSEYRNPRLLGAEGNDIVYLSDGQHGTVQWVRVSRKPKAAEENK